MTVPWWGWTIIAVYVVGFILVFWANIAVGPVTPGLSLVRAVVWPLYVTTGRPYGYRAQMD